MADENEWKDKKKKTSARYFTRIGGKVPQN